MQRLHLSVIFLLLALVGAVAVFQPSLNASWFYDDYDYVVGDPRLNSLDYFVPSGWFAEQPPLPETEDGARYLPGYGQPLFKDRFLWRLSFATERALLGLSPRVSHTVNLMLHLSCIALLFAAITRLLRLYEDNDVIAAKAEHALRVPGLAALFFAVHPWVSEPVCYISARSASLAGLFVLVGLFAWIELFRTARSRRTRTGFGLLAILSVLAAYACKEHFIMAPVGYFLVTTPLMRKNFAKSVALYCAGIVATIGIFTLLIWLGVRGSDRASGLFAQANFSKSWEYLYTIQGPILLRTLADQILCFHIGLETGFPNWSAAALFAGIACNFILIFSGTLLGVRWPALLGLGWFFIFLLPTNSILPRPDFLAMRNVYVPVMGTAAFLAAIISVCWVRFTLARLRHGLQLLTLVLMGYWTITAHSIALEFENPVLLWARSAHVSPDHATARLNFAYAMRQSDLNGEFRREIESELRAALAAEDMPAMKWHSPRPKAVRRMLALRLLGTLRHEAGFSAEAETYFSASWNTNAVLQTWLKWVEICAESKLDARMNSAIDEGFKTWPNGWWPRVVRGIHQFRIAGTVNEAIFDDLSSAFEAPNASLPDLRTLQARVFTILIELDTDPSHVDKMLYRLSELGVATADIERLKTRAMELRKQN